MNVSNAVSRSCSAARGYWKEEDRFDNQQLTWWSSLNGRLGSGPTLQVTLAPGVHEITLEAGETFTITITVS